MNTILVVDDQDRIRKTYKKVFMKEGYRVLDARSAIDAHSILEKEKIDLVLLDIRMPEVDGIVLNDITQMFHKGTKVIVSSVYPLEDQKTLIKNATDYYDKSESLKILVEKVKNIVECNVKQKKILVVEDDYNIRILYHNILKKAGYHVIETSDTATALNIFRKKVSSFDLVILDIAMPKIDGMHFFEMIKMKNTKAKVMISSVYSVDEQQMLIFGADDYFDKSEGNALFLKKVKSLLGE